MSNENRTELRHGIASQVPLSLAAFGRQLGRTQTTLWRWRKLGWLRTVNIAGRQFITPEDLREFNKRAEAGEFAREPAGVAAGKGQQSEID